MFFLHDSLVAMFVGRLARVMVDVIRWILATILIYAQGEGASMVEGDIRLLFDTGGH